MVKKLLITAIIAMVIAASLSIAGCTINLNPSNTPSSSPYSSPSSFPTMKPTAGTSTTLTSSAGFKIAVPSQYKYDRNESAPTKVYIYLDPTNNLTGIIVGTDALNSGATLDSVGRYYENQLLNFSNLSYQQEMTDTAVDSQPGKTITFTATIPLQGSAGTTSKTIQAKEIWVLHNGKSYIITYKAPPEDFSRYLPQAQQIISSFTFT